MPTGSDTDTVSLPAYYDIEKQKKKQTNAPYIQTGLVANEFCYGPFFSGWKPCFYSKIDLFPCFLI